MAQLLDYGAWVSKLQPSVVGRIYRDSEFSQPGDTLDSAFQRRFGTPLTEESLNSSHELVVVASSVDAITEWIVHYLFERGVGINVLCFKVFEHEGARLLSRAWLRDPTSQVESSPSRPENEPWNGEYYVSFGHDHRQSWEDARRFGFVSAYGGTWYTRTLSLLQPGDRIWVNVPQRGYVGVAEVVQEATTLDEFVVDGSTLAEVETDGDYSDEMLTDGERSMKLVGVKWTKTVPLASATREVGFFGNQNTVARPRAASWRRTIERLRQLWPDAA